MPAEIPQTLDYRDGQLNVEDFQDSPDDVEDTRSSHEYLNDLEEEYQARVLLSKSKRNTPDYIYPIIVRSDFDVEDGFSSTNTPGTITQLPDYPSSFTGKPPLLTLDDLFLQIRHDDEIVLARVRTSTPEILIEDIQAKLALLSSSASASKVLMVKNKGLITEAYGWDEEEVSSDDNEMVEVKVLMALAEDNDAVSKDGAKNGKWVKISMRKVHTLLEMEDNDDRNNYLEYLMNKFPYKRIFWELINSLMIPPVLGKNLVCEKSSANDTKLSIPGVEQPLLSKAEGFIMPNHDSGRILLAESQRNTIDPPVAVTDSSETDYDLVDESSVCNTPLLLLKKLDGVEPVSRPKTVKLILKSISTFKAEALKGVIINKPTSAPAKGNKSTSASKVNSTPAGKLKMTFLWLL
ncbi:hypothetical protein Tco_0899237 [Tanacetum coccineum]